MALSSVQVIQICATVMIGLSFLLSFSLIGSPDPLVEVKAKAQYRSIEIGAEHQTAILMLIRYCGNEPDPFSQKNPYEKGTECYELRKTYDLIDYEQEGQRILQKIPDKGKAFATTFNTIKTLGLIAQDLLIVPFAIAALTEAIRTSRLETLDNPASKLGLTTLLIGFILLTIVFAFNGLINSYSEINS